MRTRLRTLTLGLTALLVTAVLPTYSVKVFQKTDYTDFLVYFKAASRMKQALWDQIYNLADGASPFRYAPITLPLFRPFAELSYDAARMTWFYLQFLFFGAGFYLIYRSLKLMKNADALWAAAFSVLFTLRFMLDCFTIGQVSSLLFLGFCGGLYGWMLGRPILAAASLWPPTVFKIGPGFLYLLFLSARRRALVRAWGTPIAISLGLGGIVWLLMNQAGVPFSELWSRWAAIVASDSDYYDASHYGSQSLKSALLRAVKWGWLSAGVANVTYLTALVAGCAAVALFWLMRRPRNAIGRGLFFSLGLFPYLWFMPETFKYTLTALAIPAAFLFANPARSWLSSGALIFGVVSLSLAGKDLMTDPLFFGLQQASIPFAATLLLGIAVLRESVRNSAPSPLGRALRSVSFPEPLGPWPRAPKQASLSITVLFPVPLDQSTQLNSDLLTKAVMGIHDQCSSLGSFEILLLPYGDRISAHHPFMKSAAEWETRFREIRIVRTPEMNSGKWGRAAALRDGFLDSTGEQIWVAHPEQPCDPRFFLDASQFLGSGFDLVRGNRRLPESRFKIPVRLLKLVYGRHRMGLLFNRLVRSMLPIQTTDTHSGTLAMSRRLAQEAFSVQNSADFLFDLEISLSAVAHGWREKDLPVLLHLTTEKAHGRMFRESLAILCGLPRLAWKFRNGAYRPLDQDLADARITADDWGISPAVNEGILRLAQAGVVKRTSALATARFLDTHLTELRAVPRFEMGMHFDLTFGKSSPGKVLLRSFTDHEALRAEARRAFSEQLQTLRAHGIQPLYLDGHHHIHLVPGLLDALADLIREAGIRTIRIPDDSKLWLSGKFPLLILCVFARRALKRHGFSTLPCFYPAFNYFEDHSSLRVALSRHPGHEVIVHPAATSDFTALQIPDPYTTGRVTEYLALRMLSGERS